MKLLTLFFYYLAYLFWKDYSDTSTSQKKMIPKDNYPLF